MSELIDDSVLLYGSYDPALDEWMVHHQWFSGVEPPASGSGSGEFMVRLYGEEGEVTYVKYFDLLTHQEQGEIQEDGSYNMETLYTMDLLYVPADIEAYAIRIENRETEGVLWELALDPENRPEVRLLASPNGTIEGDFTVLWEGLDPQGKELTYKLFYSHAGGKSGTWQGIKKWSEETEREVSEKWLRGSQDISKLRVVASNGSSFGMTTSEAFYVHSKPPEIEVFRERERRYTPANGGGFGRYYVRVKGVDGQHIPESSIAWYSDVDGFLDNGTRASGYPGLSKGTHNIYVEVTDQNGVTHKEDVTTVKSVDERPIIKVRLGDGSDDLVCNKLEIAVQFDEVDMDYIDYGFNLGRGDIAMRISAAENLPIQYQVEVDTDVLVYARNLAGFVSRHRETLSPMECVDEE